MEQVGRAATRVAAIVTLADPATLGAMSDECGALARAGAHVRVLFRDESIPALCVAEVRERLAPSIPSSEEILSRLASDGDVRLYACSSSVYIWGVTAQELLPAVSGVRGLIAFLAEDVAGASRVLSY